MKSGSRIFRRSSVIASQISLPLPFKSCAIAARRVVGNLVRECERLGVAYASDDWSPLSDITLALLFEKVGIRWRHVPLEGLCEIVWPPVCGIYVMHIDRCQTPGQKRFAARHGLGHVLAGHVDDLAFAHDGHDWHGFEETVADLFALVDAIPDRELAELRVAGYESGEIERWVYAEVARWTAGWSPERILDRVALRLEGGLS